MNLPGRTEFLNIPSLSTLQQLVSLYCSSRIRKLPYERATSNIHLLRVFTEQAYLCKFGLIVFDQALIGLTAKLLWLLLETTMDRFQLIDTTRVIKKISGLLYNKNRRMFFILLRDLVKVIYPAQTSSVFGKSLVRATVNVKP